MKKTISLLLCILLAASVVTAFSLHGAAEQPQTVMLPEFDYPMMSFSAFAQTGIPYEDILSCFPETLTVKYENGAIYAKDLGCDNAYLNLNGGGCEGMLADGYWKFEASPEEYDAGGSISMVTLSHSWNVSYDISGKRGVVSLTVHDGRFSQIVSLYPTEGYGEQSVDVVYDLYEGFRVSDRYTAGTLCGQRVTVYNNQDVIYADYDAQGAVETIYVFVQETQESVFFIPDKGWSKESGQYVATDAPKGFEDATLQTLLVNVPTDIGCTHDWQSPCCDVESLCTVCKRQKGEPLGHKWVAGSMNDTCSACNAIRYRVADVTMPSFDARPYFTLEQTGIDFDALTSGFVKKISTKYQNGIFMVPNIDGYYFSPELSSEGFLKYKTVNGWNLIEVAQKDLAQLEIIFFKNAECGEQLLDYEFKYNSDGNLVCFNLREAETEKNIQIQFDKNTVRVSYPKDTEGKVIYTDVYQNRTLFSQIVHDKVADIQVTYNSDLKVQEVFVSVDAIRFYFLPEKGWSTDPDGKNPVSAPEGYEDKDAAYFAKAYPHTVDFCIHSYETAQDGTFKKCVKCGETVALEKETDFDPKVIIFVSAGAVLAAVIAAVVIMVIKRSKRKKNNADQ